MIFRLSRRRRAGAPATASAARSGARSPKPASTSRRRCAPTGQRRRHPLPARFRHGFPHPPAALRGRRLTRMAETWTARDEERERVRALLNDMLARYHLREPQQADANTPPRLRERRGISRRPALAALAKLLDLRPLDHETDERSPPRSGAARQARPARAAARLSRLSLLRRRHPAAAAGRRARRVRSDQGRPHLARRCGRDPQGRHRRDPEGHPVQQLRRLLQPRLSRERLSLGPAARRRPADRHHPFGPARRAWR